MPATLTPENSMTGPKPSRPEPRLTLKCRLDELVLVWPWVEALVGQYAMPAQTHYAIQLCLEEALSNIMRHGYKGRADQTITVDFSPAGKGNEEVTELVFIIEDHAPPFDPLAAFAACPAPHPASIEELEPGGQGIRLMQKFASRIVWEPLPGGNRLTLAFALPH